MRCTVLTAWCTTSLRSRPAPSSGSKIDFPSHTESRSIYLTVTYFVLLVEVTFSTLCLLMIAPQNRRLEGVWSMVTGFLFLLVANLLVLGGPHEPAFLAYVLANVVLLLGTTLLHFSFPEIRRHSRWQRFISGALALMLLAGTSWFTYGIDSHAWRVFFVSFALAAQTGLTAYMLVRYASPEVRYPAKCTACFFALHAGIQTWRMVWILFTHKAPDEVPGSVMRWVVLLGYAMLAATVPLLYFWLTTVRLQGRLEKLAFTDSLTELLNRRGIEQEGAIELSRLARAADSPPLALILFDLDSFKQLNDRYGHPAGDYVLRMIAQLTSSALRNFDRLARIGGEEFLVILPQTTEGQAIEIAERLRSLIEAASLHFEGNVIRMTSSFGVVATHEHADSWEDLMRRADAFLYQAKSSGRNCVVGPNGYRTGTALEHFPYRRGV